METKIVINWTSIIFGIFSVVVSLFGYFVVRMVRGYDDQIKELFERTKDLPAIREALCWIKEKLYK